MVIGRVFGKLFGSGAAAESPIEPVAYKGFLIVADPIPEGDQYRTAGYISRDGEPEGARSRFIRADLHGSQESAIDHSIRKGRQVIDEQGEGLLARENV